MKTFRYDDEHFNVWEVGDIKDTGAYARMMSKCGEVENGCDGGCHNCIFGQGNPDAFEAWEKAQNANHLDTEKRPVTIPDQGAGQFAAASQAEGKGGI